MIPVIRQEETRCRQLGEAKIQTPMSMHFGFDAFREIRYNPYCNDGREEEIGGVSFELSVPHEKIFFDPKKVRAAIVTCGGICPGINNVIRSIVLRLWFGYGVRHIYGIRYGLQGLVSKYSHDFMDLTPDLVSNIHELGGTVLGSSRGSQPMEEIVDTLEQHDIQMLFVIGGDGSLRAAQKIDEEVSKRNKKIAVVGVPKTIDNDISFVARSFGFETAVEVATQAIKSAHTEAKSFPNGIGLVKLMGRHSGYIASTAALAQRDVNIVLIPEVDFDLEGNHGLLEHLRERLETRGHAVIVVAEGAGQKFFSHATETDQSGNVKLHDIGTYLKNRINAYFQTLGQDVSLKYIDPSYMIRSVPANTHDGLYCATLGQNAVHAAMAGYTGMIVSYWHGVYCRIPLALVTREKKTINPNQGLWLNVLESTGQPDFRSAHTTP